jgi:hypothetical protein
LTAALAEVLGLLAARFGFLGAAWLAPQESNSPAETAASPSDRRIFTLLLSD